MTTRPPVPVPPRARLKTYSHLSGFKRIPNDYEIGTSRLLYYREKRFSVKTPVTDWYRAYQEQSPLHCDDWELFRDPRETTYTSYTSLMSQREAFVRRLFQRIEDSDYDAQLSAEALAFHDRILAPLRFPLHGLQMSTSYVGQMAPGGRIVVACAFQTADEIRRIQHLSYRIGLLRRREPTCAERSRADWQERDLWQPLRRLIEQLLVTWDWGQSFAALCLGVKPVFDELIAVDLAERARSLGDYLMAELLGAQVEESRWHRSWAQALIQVAIAERPENREPLRSWITEWSHRTEEAVQPILLAVGTGSRRLQTSVVDHLTTLRLASLDPPENVA